MNFVASQYRFAMFLSNRGTFIDFERTFKSLRAKAQIFICRVKLWNFALASTATSTGKFFDLNPSCCTELSKQKNLQNAKRQQYNFLSAFFDASKFKFFCSFRWHIKIFNILKQQALGKRSQLFIDMIHSKIDTTHSRIDTSNDLFLNFQKILAASHW